jgi:hypothetical protein
VEIGVQSLCARSDLKCAPVCTKYPRGSASARPAGSLEGVSSAKPERCWPRQDALHRHALQVCVRACVTDKIIDGVCATRLRCSSCVCACFLLPE